MNQKRYHVFLSHNSADKAAVEVIARRLREEEQLEPFLDTWHLVPGEPWQEGLEWALDESDTCAVFLGTYGLGTWDNEAMRAALDIRADNPDFRVIPVLLPGATFPERGRLPRFLARLKWVDFRTGLDDAQAFHELVSGIQGVAPGPVDLPDVMAMCPFRGLEIFEEKHAEFFFGREALTQHLVEQLRTDRFLAVIGASGSGKSSLVRAGLLPQVRHGALPNSQDWPVILIKPGPHPIDTLASGLLPLLGSAADPLAARQTLLDTLARNKRGIHVTVQTALAAAADSQRVLLVVDQFEEVFTLCHDDAERHRFIDNLWYVSSIPGGQIVAVITMRADFLGKCAAYPDLAARLKGLELIGPMDAADLRRAMIDPAEKVGLHYDKGLIESILEDLGDEVGGLPLLQHTLLELWERRRGGWLTTDAYHAIGGVRGALAQRSDAVYKKLTLGQQEIARRVLLRLTQPGDGTEDTRRRAPLAELLPGNDGNLEVEAVVRTLADARLLTTSSEEREGGTVEVIDVVHEALIRGWPRLQRWINESRTALRVHRQLTEAADIWQRNGRDPSYLFRGARLAAAREWAQTHNVELSELERAFLEASIAERDQEEQEREAQRQREVETAHKLAEEAEARRGAEEQHRQEAEARAQEQTQVAKVLRQRAILLAILGFAAVLIAGIALALYIRSERQRQITIARQLEAQTLADLDAHPQRSLLTAVEAISISQETGTFSRVNAQTLLYQILGATGGIPLGGNGVRLSAIAFNPDGHLLGTGGDDGRIFLWDVDAPEKTAKILGSKAAAITVLAFSTNVRKPILAAGRADGSVELWNMNNLQVGPISLSGSTRAITALVFSGNGRWFATGSDDGTARIWDLQTPNAFTGTPTIIQDPGCTAPPTVFNATFSRNGRWLAIGFWCNESGRDRKDGVVQLYDLTGPSPFDNPKTRRIDQVLMLAISPDSRWFAASRSYYTELWDLDNLGNSFTEKGNGKLLIDPTLKNGQTHSQFVDVIAFSPDSRWLATGSNDTKVKLWDLAASSSSNNPQVLRGHGAAIRSIAFSSDGHWLVTAGDDNTARLWNLTDPRIPAFVLRGHEAGIIALAINSHDDHLATISNDTTVRLWSLPDAYAEPVVLRGHEDTIQAIAFSPLITSSTGLPIQWVATGSDDNTVRLWNVSSPLTKSLKLNGHDNTVKDVAFSPNGRWLATASEKEEVVRLWERPYNNASIKPFLLSGHTDGITDMGFSSDGHWLATASWDGTIRLWNMTAANPYSGSLVLDEHRGIVTGIDFSDDGHWLVSGSDDGTVKVWDLSSPNPANNPITLLGDRGGVVSVAVSRDGRWVAAGSGEADAKVRVWNMEKPDAAPLILQFKRGVFDLDFSPDGRWLAAGSWDSTVQLLDLSKTDSKPIVLKSHQGRILAVTFSPDNQWLATGGEDQTVRLWYLAESVAVPIVLRSNQSSSVGFPVVFSSDGRWLATGSDDASTRLWPLQLDDLIGIVCQTAGRNLSEQEWQQFLSDRPYHKTCPNLPLHPSFVEKGRDLARSGDIKGAVAQFKKVLTLEPTLDLDPEQEARHVATSTFIAKGQELAKAGDIKGAQQQFQQALSISPTLVLSPSMEIRRLAVPVLRAKGQELARAGDIEGAMAQFKRTLELDPTLDLKPEVEIRIYQAKGLLDKAIDLAWVGDINGTIAQLRRAKEVNPELDFDLGAYVVTIADWLAKNDRFKEAVAAYLEAQTLNSNVQFSAQQRNELCWDGSLSGRATEVLKDCSQAVELASEDEVASYQDSRGLARALTGDVKGAIEDFKAFVDWAEKNSIDTEIIVKRKRWIENLEANRSPLDVFDAATLEQLRHE